MEEKNVLIVDPDSGFSADLKAALQRIGHTSVIAIDAESALDSIHRHKFHSLIIECMLPGMGGVDLALQIRKIAGYEQTPILLMSGIFIEKAFIKESKNSVSAIDFLKKPFVATDVINYFKTEVKKTEDTSLRDMYRSFSLQTINAKEKLRILENVEQLHSYDLPFVLSLLVESKASGYLNVVDAENRISGVTFKNGHIVQVDVSDSQSYLGQILLNKGLVLAEDLEKVLSSPSGGKRIAAKLIDGNFISPHALDEALIEQMNIRLSKIIINSEIRISFSKEIIEIEGPSISPENFDEYLYVWIMSKLSREWLLNHYMIWSETPLKFGPYYIENHPFFRLALLNEHEEFLIESIRRGRSISQLAMNPNLGEDQAFKIIHLLICKGLVLFEEGKKVMTYHDQEVRLNKWLDQLASRDLLSGFELIGGTLSMSDIEMTRVFVDFIDDLGPPPLESDPKDFKVVFDKVKTIVENIQIQVGTTEKIQAYLQNLENEKLEKFKKIETEVSEFRQLIGKQMFRQAKEHLPSLTPFKEQIPNLSLLIIQVKLLTLPEGESRGSALKELEVALGQVSPEEKNSDFAMYLFGLFYKNKGDIVNAQRSFERALTLNSNNFQAKQELTMMVASRRPSKENKSVLGKIFS